MRDRKIPEAKLPHLQVDSFLGGGVPEEAVLWSKAGQNSWTGDERASWFKHDLIRMELAGRAPIILCLMTQRRGICEKYPIVSSEIGKLFCERQLS